MVRRSQGSHLMPVTSILEVEVFDLLRNLHTPSLSMSVHGQNGTRVFEQETDLSRREEIPPLVYELREHAVWTTFLDFSEAAKDGKFVVCHAHVSLFTIKNIVSIKIELLCSCREDGPRRLEHNSR